MGSRHRANFKRTETLKRVAMCQSSNVDSTSVGDLSTRKKVWRHLEHDARVEDAVALGEKRRKEKFGGWRMFLMELVMGPMWLVSSDLYRGRKSSLAPLPEGEGVSKRGWFRESVAQSNLIRYPSLHQTKKNTSPPGEVPGINWYPVLSTHVGASPFARE